MRKKITLFFSFFVIASYAQNNCAEAQLVTAGTYTITEIDGIAITTSCVGNGNGTKAEWYKYIPTANFTTTISTDLETNICKDTRIQIFVGNCGALDCIDGDDDAGTLQCNNGQNDDSYLSKATFNAIAGNIYYFSFCAQ